jgi:hypothetical protein
MAEINLLAAVTFIWNPQCSRGWFVGVSKIHKTH